MAPIQTARRQPHRAAKPKKKKAPSTKSAVVVSDEDEEEEEEEEEKEEEEEEEGNSQPTKRAARTSSRGRGRGRPKTTKAAAADLTLLSQFQAFTEYQKTHPAQPSSSSSAAVSTNEPTVRATRSSSKANAEASVLPQAPVLSQREYAPLPTEFGFRPGPAAASSHPPPHRSPPYGMWEEPYSTGPQVSRGRGRDYDIMDRSGPNRNLERDERYQDADAYDRVDESARRRDFDRAHVQLDPHEQRYMQRPWRQDFYDS